ncbi:MAG: lysylphosphatidylglycerol synthase transmembrane domain-containing protein [Nitrososphaera sp.]
MNWRIVAILASVVPFLVLFLTTKVSPGDVFALGVVPFAMSATAALSRNFLQAIRFKYYIRRFIGRDVSSTAKTVEARLGGEFVTSTTPSYVGGEFVRIAWLAKNGVPPGKAAWVATMEIITDVFVGSMLAFMAGIVAILRGGTVIGSIVILVTIPTFAVWLVLVLVSSKRTLRLPNFVLPLLQKFIAKQKAQSLVESANTAISDLCQMSRENFGQKKTLATFAAGLAITFVAFIAYGASFMILANAAGSKIGLFDSLMSTSASTSIANLPITIGGSALAELGIWAYLANLSGIPDYSAFVHDSQLKVIIAWRITTYHIPLAVSWIALMRLTTRKATPPNPDQISVNPADNPGDPPAK